MMWWGELCATSQFNFHPDIATIFNHFPWTTSNNSLIDSWSYPLDSPDCQQMIFSNCWVLRLLKYVKIISIQITTFRAHNNSKCFHFRFRFPFIFLVPFVGICVKSRSRRDCVCTRSRRKASDGGGVRRSIFLFEARFLRMLSSSSSSSMGGSVGSMYRASIVHKGESERCECKEGNYTHHNKFS